MSNKIISDYRSEALQGTIKLVDSKGNEKICVGTKPIILSNQWKPAKVKKGDLISIDGKQYRVLKIDGNVAEVFCMYDASSSISFNSRESNVYANRELDTYCNSTFYNSLAPTIKSAIIDKTFTQDSWIKESSIPIVSHYTGVKKDVKTYYYLSLVNLSYGSSITRHCYSLSIQDVLDYLGTTTSMDINNTTLNATNISQMFWNQSTSATTIWLRSADASTTESAFYVLKSTSSIETHETGLNTYTRPAFQIDLSKVDYAIL